MESIQKVSKSQRLAATILNGGLAGLAGVVSTFPIDLCKTRLQNQQVVKGKIMYKGLFDCLRSVLKKEGFRSLYRGVLPNLVLIVPEKTIKLSVNDFMRGFLSKDGVNVTPTCQLIAAATAGFCQVVVTSPMEIMKIYGQDAGRIHAMNGGGASVVSRGFPLRVFLQQYGIRGFYKGSAATLLRDIPFSMIYFPLFSLFNKQALWMYQDEILYPLVSTTTTSDGYIDTTTQHRTTNPQIPLYHTLPSAMFAGMIAASSVNPADIVKTRLQSIHAGSRKYNGVADCVKRIYIEEGALAFFRGSQARAMVIGPLFGIAQSVFGMGIGEMITGIPKSTIL